MDADVRAAGLAADLGARLTSAGARVATVESCTGGGIAQAITAVAGASDWFDYGFVTYSNAAKTALVGVPADLIRAHGAVSAPVAAAMAEGGLQGDSRHGGDGGGHAGGGGSAAGAGAGGGEGTGAGGGAGADYCVAVTGVAGPGGGTPRHPVGTVYFGWAGRNRATVTARAHFPGDRTAIRAQTVLRALDGLLEFIPAE